MALVSLGAGGGPRDRNLIDENIWNWDAIGDEAKRFMESTAIKGRQILEHSGWLDGLKPGDTIVEASSGNTGISFAAIGLVGVPAQFGHTSTAIGLGNEAIEGRHLRRCTLGTIHHQKAGGFIDFVLDHIHRCHFDKCLLTQLKGA